MDIKKIIFSRKLLAGVLTFIPILIILLVIIFRNMINPSNEDIVNKLRNTKYYTAQVEYIFKNNRAEFKEETYQYYSSDMGRRIEFKEGYEPVKVYKGGEIKVQGEENEEFTLEKNIDELYPLAFIDNILYNPINEQIEVVKSEWGDDEYIKIKVNYSSKNKHLNKAEFYINKNKGVPELLSIMDDNDKERVRIIYKDFKVERSLDDSLF